MGDGALDDYPAVVNGFYNDLCQGLTDSFNKLAAAEKIVYKSLYPDRHQEGEGASLRRVLIFYRYLKRRLLSECRITPMVIKHICDSAYACLGKKIAGNITKSPLCFPQGKKSRKDTCA